MQLRTRLARRGFAEADVEQAIARLTEERALDDARVAAAIARTQTGLRRRGRMRVRLEIERAGISRQVAQQALDEVFEDVDDEALIEAALGKRLRHGRAIADERELARLYRYLVTQGFSSDQALRVLKRRRTGHDDEP